MNLKMVRPIALFDIDGTIFRSSLLLEVLRRLIQRDIFPRSCWTKIAPLKQAWKNRTGTYQAYLNAAIRVFEYHIAGASVADVIRITQEVIDELSERVYRYPRSLIQSLRSRGYFLVAISGSHTYVVQPFVERLGFDLFRAAEFETDGTRFTGQILNRLVWTDKGQVLDGIVTNLPFKVDLAESYAIGDTEADIPCLSRVGHPIAFNPNTILALHAEQMGWPIVIERKDLVVELEHGHHRFLTHL